MYLVCSWLHFVSTEKVQEVKKNFLQESGIQFSELEEKVLQFHLSNLEYACGSTLEQVWRTETLRGSKIFCEEKFRLQRKSSTKQT